MFRHTILALLLGVTCAAAYDEKDPVKEKLFAAKVAYDKEMSAFRKAADEWLDKREEAARKAGDKKALGTVKADRKAFEEDGALPKTAPVAIQQISVTARKTLETAYSQAVKDYIKAKKDEEATAVEKDFATFKTDAAKRDQAARARELLIGKWAWGDNTMTLFQNGTVLESNPKGGLVSKGKWKVETDGLLVELENGYSCRGVLRENGKLVATCTAPTGAQHIVEATKKKEK
ncbi:hypothetical protein [Frigoriglobus tundricola]|uniref:Uncharacterized protein n=1 Tax=Frigoriglobus tundricola TaxID=2774151 RepID=A0A6M5Z304_9BACT|nr:hypothetical protein [Frigoriglobus tundricola]QJX00075.1 hypothetical protein FTUN_7699 [Frigoriglobus tundricola]